MGSHSEAVVPQPPRIPDGSFLSPGALKVEQSRIAGAGMGLFAQERIEPGAWICEYLGERKSLMQILRMKDRQYVMGTGCLNCHIDATSYPKAFARYVNDNGNRSALNAEFVKIKSEGRVLLRATGELLKGEEIYASYGEVFWRNRKHQMSSTTRCGPVLESGHQTVVSG